MTCPTPGCDYPAGTACTMQDCPGRNIRRSPGEGGSGPSFTLRSRHFTAPEQQTPRNGPDGLCSPVNASVPFHASDNTGEGNPDHG